MSKVKYFLSGASGIRGSVLPDVASLIDYRLLSMHKAFKGNTRVWCDISHHPKCAMKEVMLDSGAFTAFTKGHKVELDSLIAVYDDTMRKLSKKIKEVWLINLDVIPGEPGRVATPQEFEEALSRSDANYKVLKKKYGDRVIPVYHRTEGESRLMSVARMSNYVGIGFGPKTGEEYRVKHAEEALALLVPQGKIVHGLATTGYRMLARVPFDSVDSATWLYIAAMGGISFVDDSGDISNIAISSSSPKQRELRGHYRNMHDAERSLIERRAKEAGVTIEQLESDLSYRILFNAHQLREWLLGYKRPIASPPPGLFPL